MHAVLAGDRLQRRPAPRAMVSRRPSSRADVVRRAGRLALLVDVGRVDRRRPRASKRPSAQAWAARCCDCEAELVGVVAGDAPLVGDALGALELRRQLVAARSSDFGIGAAEAESFGAARRRSGTRLMTSTPQATATSTTPDADERRRRGWWPAATSRTGCRRWWRRPSSGRPAASHAVRAMLNVCSPTWLTQPPTTWPIAPGRCRCARRAPSARRRAGRRDARWTGPPRRPTGVRTASTMTTEDSLGMGLSLRRLGDRAAMRSHQRARRGTRR